MKINSIQQINNTSSASDTNKISKPNFRGKLINNKEGSEILKNSLKALAVTSAGITAIKANKTEEKSTDDIRKEIILYSNKTNTKIHPNFIKVLNEQNKNYAIDILQSKISKFTPLEQVIFLNSINKDNEMFVRDILNTKEELLPSNKKMSFLLASHNKPQDIVIETLKADKSFIPVDKKDEFLTFYNENNNELALDILHAPKEIIEIESKLNFFEDITKTRKDKAKEILYSTEIPADKKYQELLKVK